VIIKRCYRRHRFTLLMKYLYIYAPPPMSCRARAWLCQVCLYFAFVTISCTPLNTAHKIASIFHGDYTVCVWAGYLSRYSDWLRTERSEIESQWGRDFPPVQTGPRAHPTSCKMSTGSFPGVKCGRSVLLTTHLLLVLRSWKSRAIPLNTLWVTPGL